MTRGPDMLEVYLDRIPDTEKEEVRLLVHGMRLFALSAQKDLSPKVDLPILAARAALRDLQVRQLEQALGTILCALLQAPTQKAVEPGFGTWPESRWLEGLTVQGKEAEEASRTKIGEAWHHLRECLPTDLKLPVPGTPWAEVAEELLCMASKIQLAPAWIQLWKARLGWVLRGPAFAEQALARWAKRFDSSSSIGLAQEVAMHRIALSQGAGLAEKTGVGSKATRGQGGIGRTSEMAPWLALVVDGAASECSLGNGPDPRAAVPRDTDLEGLLAPALGVDKWSWSGSWGSLGCWVATCSPRGGMRWMQNPGGESNAGAKPDELESRAIARLGLAVSPFADRGKSVSGARSKGARLRACVCVWMAGENPTEKCLRPGRIMGWVTWEWSHGIIPEPEELLHTAKRLVMQACVGPHVAGEGRVRDSEVQERAGMALTSWFEGLLNRREIHYPATFWQPIGRDWVRVCSAAQPGGVLATELTDPSILDFERCDQVGSTTIFWNEGLSGSGELTPIMNGGAVSAIVAAHANAPGVDAPLTVLGRDELVMWDLARFLDNGDADSAGSLSIHLPFGDPSFVSFIGRLASARDRAQHVALVAHPQGVGGSLVRWLDDWNNAKSKLPWRCEWIRGESQDVGSFGEVLRGWEGHGEPFQVFHVPALSLRRNEVIGWVRGLRVSRSSQLEWTDAALAAMWRQPWLGQEKQLMSVVLHLVQLARGPVTREDVASALSERGLEVVKRLESKRPLPSDISAALSATRSKSGRVNKSRASMYLGWDPDTLVGRMRDLDWLEGGAPDPDPWAGC